VWAVAALVLLFIFRLLFGLSSELFFEDETQIFLIGLRYYATGHWPFFGPDVVWTRSEIPGALQGLLVGLPLRIAPIPESPYVLLNVISAAALAAEAWYICARVPSAPRWLVWGWLFTIPWTMQFSTHIINPSYVLAAAVAFFIGFFETVSSFRLGLVRPAAAFALMGAALLWVMQIHMSWPLLLPYAAYAAFARRRDGAVALLGYAAAFLGGAIVPALALVPTWLHFGGQGGSGGVVRNLQIHFVSPFIAVSTLARFFSFASLEIVRFIATDNAKRLEFFLRHPFLIPFALVVWAVGIVQPIWMLVEWVRRNTPDPAWSTLRLIVGASVLLVYASYWFVLEPAQAHAFYVLAPIAWLFAAWCWSFVDGPRMRIAAAAVLAINIAFHAGLAWAQAPERSLYKNRAPVAAAITYKQPEMMGHRRAFAIDGGPAVLADPSRPYDPTRDVQVVRSTLQIGIKGSLNWTIVVRNANPRVAFRDLLYVTTYRDAAGRTIDERHEFIKDIFEPGDSREVVLNDRFRTVPFTSAALRIVAAEALLPDVPENVRE
jgi:hypothetical protein